MNKSEVDLVVLGGMAQLMDTSASEMLDRIDTRLPKDSQTLKMQALYIKDAANHLEIAEYLAKEDVVAAARVACKLDSYSRDKMPASVWNFLRPFMVV